MLRHANGRLRIVGLATLALLAVASIASAAPLRGGYRGGAYRGGGVYLGAYRGGYGYRPYWGGSSYRGGYGYRPYYRGGYAGAWPRAYSAYPYSGGYGYSAPAYVAPPVVVPAPIVSNSYTPGVVPVGYEAATGNQARIRIRIPANAEVWIGGEPTTQRGMMREFVSPPLATGKDFVYTVRARWMTDSGPEDQTREVHVQANETSEVDFTAAPIEAKVAPPAVP